MSGRGGYLVIMLMLAVFILSLGLTVAVPVWQTQLQREKEEELIFRGKQYVEAVRIYLAKNPGRFPAALKDLLEKKCIRRLFRDPMSPTGEWNIILNPGTGGAGQGATQEVMVAPEKALASIRNPQIIGVVSASMKKSIRIWNEQESYDKWLFYYGQDPKKLPKIIPYGEKR